VIELVTYRAAAHSTSDDPTRYRPAQDYGQWPLGDPVDRLKRHLTALGEWSDERHAALTGELEEHVTESWKEAVQYGALNEGPRLDAGLMFEDVYERMPLHLQKQRDQQKAELG